MSTYYARPRVFTKCHVHQILSDALATTALDINELGNIVQAEIPMCNKISYIVEYNVRDILVPFFGTTKSCTRAVIECYCYKNKYYYPILRVEDYGNEGNTSLVGYLVSDQDLVSANKSLFDTIVVSGKLK